MTLSLVPSAPRWVTDVARAIRTPTHAAPYAADGSADFYGVNNPAGTDAAFADGPSGNTQYVFSPGWAPTLREGTDNTPDPQRTEEMPRTDRRANLRNPLAWWRKLDADTAARESVVQQQSIGFTELKGGSGHGRAPDPRWTPPPESRPTQQMSPHTYLFQRPFDQTIARRLSGQHVSMAVNRRNYDILTMTPVTNRRNTYRVEPSPWDTDIVDETPSATEGRPSARLQSPNIMPAPSSAYRLG